MTPTRLCWWPFAVVVAAVAIGHFFASPCGEPFKNHDECRHVMTGVFVRDAVFDFSTSSADPKGYAVRYYTQYPALGLLVWPPLFYVVEGLAMCVGGTSYLTARVVLTLYAILAGAYAYRLFARTHGPEVAAIAIAILGFSPVVFDNCRYVMLEVPTLAMVLAAIFHFERYLTDIRAKDAWFACLFAAAAALTRFDGVMLLPYFLIRLTATRQYALLLQRNVILAAIMALLLTAPYYLFTWREYQAGMSAAATAGTASFSTGFFDLDNLWLYPSFIPWQIGFVPTAAAALGLGVSLRRAREVAGPYFALIGATFLTFVPLAEPESRHAIYWVPALTLFAAVSIDWAFQYRRWLGGLAAAVGVAMTIQSGVSHIGFEVRGYEDAAQYVVAHRSTNRPILFDGDLTGGFIYQVRRADPERTIWVLRGDKLFYAVLSDPHGKYQEFAATEAEVLSKLHEADPEWIVVESPPLLFDLPAATRLRDVLAKHPDRFEKEHEVELRANKTHLRSVRLELWRKRDRNPAAPPPAAIPVLGLGRALGSG